MLAQVIQFPSNQNTQVLNDIITLFNQVSNPKYTQAVERFFGNSIKSITIGDISSQTKVSVLDYFKSNFDGLSSSYMTVQRSAIKKFYDVVLEVCEEQGVELVKSNPAESIALSQFIKDASTKGEATNMVRNIYSDMMDDLLKSIADKSCGVKADRDSMAVKLMCRVGLRREELVNLKAGDIVQIGGKRFVNVIEGKGGKSRFIDINVDFYNEIMGYVAQYKLQPTDSVFFNTRTFKEIKDLSLVNKTLAEYSDGKVEPHDCRRFFASRNYENSAKIDDIREMLGHSSENMTHKYININSKLKIDRNRL